ncbi:MAG: hypothetical protein KJ964_11050 [Verrucomicrobia bacterium]|nr:hypothetical protein [Verrucomicrobiota bacterium]MBU1733812.1 hypothetical protein [Verrucomicrobiota bacterium]MBU1857187.1 hypothetical protein [Verrucomicrobiota bacterium]
MRKFLTVMTLLAIVVMIPCAMAKDKPAAKDEGFTLWGKQIAGSGHAKNAKLEGDTLVLAAPAKIISVKADCDAYSIWSAVTPENRQAKVVLSGGKGRKDIVGQTLQAGSYRVIPGLDDKKNTAMVTITLK